MCWWSGIMCWECGWDLFTSFSLNSIKKEEWRKCRLVCSTMLVVCAKCLLLFCCQNVMWDLYLNTKQTLTTTWQLHFYPSKSLLTYAYILVHQNFICLERCYHLINKKEIMLKAQWLHISYVPRFRTWFVLWNIVFWTILTYLCNINIVWVCHISMPIEFNVYICNMWVPGH